MQMSETTHGIRDCPRDGDRSSDLLLLAEREFDVSLNVGRRLQYQQGLAVFNIAVIIMLAATSRLSDLQLLIPRVVERLLDAKGGQATVVGE